jgi:hypothetical protein
MAIPWHRIFGMALTQYFAGTAWQVDVEVDLSLQQQRLDVAILRRKGAGTAPRWPDGFGTPADYNLLTFKALQDPLTPWALKELAAHSVNYRKQMSPNPDDLLPEDQFRLLAASMRFPQKLASQVTLQPQGPGAYDVVWGTDTIRILVLREMPEAEQNLVWNLFSSDPQRIAAAFQRLQPRSQSWSSLLNSLMHYYGLEGMAMPYTMEDFKRDAAQDLLNELTPEERLKGLRPEERLKGLRPEELLAHLSREQRLQGLSPELLLSLLPLAEIENYVKKQKAARGKEASERPETPS